MTPAISCSLIYSKCKRKCDLDHSTLHLIHRRLHLNLVVILLHSRCRQTFSLLVKTLDYDFMTNCLRIWTSSSFMYFTSYNLCKYSISWRSFYFYLRLSIIWVGLCFKSEHYGIGTWKHGGWWDWRGLREELRIEIGDHGRELGNEMNGISMCDNTRNEWGYWDVDSTGQVFYRIFGQRREKKERKKLHLYFVPHGKLMLVFRFWFGAILNLAWLGCYSSTL